MTRLDPSQIKPTAYSTLAARYFTEFGEKGQTLWTNVQRFGVDEVRCGERDQEIREETNAITKAECHSPQTVVGYLAGDDPRGRTDDGSIQTLEYDNHGDNNLTGCHSSRTYRPNCANDKHKNSLHCESKQKNWAASDKAVEEDTGDGADERHRGDDDRVDKRPLGSRNLEEVGLVA